MQDKDLQILVDTKEEMKQDLKLYEILHHQYMQRIMSQKEKIPLDETDITYLQQKEQTLSLLIQDTQSEVEHLTSVSIPQIQRHIYTVYEQLRQLSSIIAGLMLQTDFQSPSFDGMPSQAGRLKGSIEQAINDYKRDKHKEANDYEYAFRKAYVDHSFFKPVRIFATNSGMSAFTTILSLLNREVPESIPRVFIGKHSYFENKHVVQTLFHHVEEFLENDEYSIDAMLRSRPHIICADTLCNDQTMISPSLVMICKKIQSITDYHPYVVIDATTTPLLFKPWKDLPSIRHLFIWESLLKHHQFGLDRTNGGIIYAQSPIAPYIYTERDHLGTNLTDVQALMLPQPHRQRLFERLYRHTRNHTYLAQLLEQWIVDNPNGVLSQIISPSLPSHAAYKPNSYPGAYFCLQFKYPYQNITFYQRFLKSMMKNAKKADIPLVAGTSFGLPITRLYIPASRKGQGTPFFRIAVGTETMTGITMLGQLFCDTLNREFV